MLSLSHLTDTEKYPRGRRGSPAKGVVRETVARVQIPLSPPSRVAFEPAALLFLYQGCCRHHNRHRSLCPTIIRLLLDTEKRCPRQLYKIGGECRCFSPNFAVSGGSAQHRFRGSRCEKILLKSRKSHNDEAGKNFLLDILPL